MGTFRTTQNAMDYKIESVLRILIVFLSAIYIHRALVFEYCNEQKTQIIDEYRGILFVPYFSMFLCLTPICDILTDFWTLFLYFGSNEVAFATIAIFLLFVSFRFHTLLWLLLKEWNAHRFIIYGSEHEHFKFFVFIFPFLIFGCSRIMIANE